MCISFFGSTTLGLNAAVDVNGTVYAFDIPAGQVVTLDLTTGAISPVSVFAPANDFVVTGATLAPTAVPEPAPLAGVGAGLLAAAVAGRRPKTRGSR